MLQYVRPNVASVDVASILLFGVYAGFTWSDKFVKFPTSDKSVGIDADLFPEQAE